MIQENSLLIQLVGGMVILASLLAVIEFVVPWDWRRLTARIKRGWRKLRRK